MTSGWNLSSPRSGTIYDDARSVRGVSRPDTGSAAIGGEHFEYRGSGHEVHATMLGRFDECAARGRADRRCAPAETRCFPAASATVPFARVPRRSVDERLRNRAVSPSPKTAMVPASRRSADSPDSSSTSRTKSGYIFGAGSDQRLQALRNVRIAVGDHASGGVGGFAGGLLLFDHEHAEAVGP